MQLILLVETGVSSVDQQNISELEGEYGRIIVVHAKQQGNKEEIDELYRVLVESLLRQEMEDVSGKTEKGMID
jgi:hypothetical protein